MPLTPAQDAILVHLRREVDRYQDLSHQTNVSAMDAKARLFRAREELREFTDGLRKEGYRI